MSVRVAFLGDSHLASLALAARSMELGPLRPTFFAHIMRRLANLEVLEGCLQTHNQDLRRILKATSGGAEKIDPECYDLFVLMGLEFEFPFRCLREPFYSRAVTEQTLRDHTSRSLLFQTLGKLRQITARPVWILHNPLVDPTRCNRRPEVLTYDRFLEIADEIFRPLDAAVLPQPAETRIDDHFSLPELSRAAISLHHLTGAPNPIGTDIHHKSETFGRSVLRDLRDRLQTFPDDGRPDTASAARDPWRPRRLGTVLERDGEELLLRLGEGDDGVRLNLTAAAIWERCDGTRTEPRLLVELRELFGAPEGDLRHDLRGALEGLVGVGALEPEPVQPETVQPETVQPEDVQPETVQPEAAPAVHPFTNVDEGHLGGYIRASASRQGSSHGDPQTWEPGVWKWAVDTFAAESVLDVGCGEAHSTRCFRDLGCRVLGIDGSVQAQASSAIPDRHARHDFVDGPFLPDEAFDLVWSCEFVEHVEKRFADHFLATFAVARKAVLMTFASPRQPGWHHVNCQPESYWVENVERLGFQLDRQLTDRGRAIARGMHFAHRGLVFVRTAS